MNFSIINLYKKLRFLFDNYCMMKKGYTYYYNPYLPENRQGKGEKMSLIRAMLLLCITTLISVGAITFSRYQKDRFEIVPLQNGVFIFDRQSTGSNFCNSNKCIVLSNEFLVPKKVLVAEIPGVITRNQIRAENPKVQERVEPRQQNFANPGFNRSGATGYRNNAVQQNSEVQQQDGSQDQERFSGSDQDVYQSREAENNRKLYQGNSFRN